MKTNWQTKKLGEVCEIKPPKKEARDRLNDDDLVSFVPMEDLGILTKDFVAIKERPLKEVSGSYTYFSDNDVLLAKITPCFENGKIGIARNLKNGIGFGSSEYIVFRSRGEVIPDYLYYYLARDRFRQDGEKVMTGAVGHKRVPKDFIENQEIPYPKPLPEQQRIVAILDEAFAAIATAKENAEKNLQNAHELFQSVLSQAVIGELTKEWREEQGEEKTKSDTDLKEIHLRIKGREKKTSRSEETTGHGTITKALPKEWQFTSIESLFNLIDYRGKNPPRTKNGRRLITAKNIKMGYLSDEPITFVSEETYRKWMVRGFPKPDDIFFVTEGHTMGFVALNTRNDDFALAQRTITLQPIVSFSTKYFFYFMMSFYFQSLVKLNATGAAAVGMKASKFRSLPLPFPSFVEQQRIVAKLDALSDEAKKLEAIYRQKLADLDELKKSVLEKAFSGDI